MNFSGDKEWTSISLLLILLSIKRDSASSGCEAAVRASLTREFGRAVPFLFYAPPWVAQYLSSSQQVQLARGVPDVIQLMTDRIVRLGRDHTNGAPRVLVASYNVYVRRAARQAGAANGVAVGAIQLADYANNLIPQRAEIEWSGSESSGASAIPVPADDRRGQFPDRAPETRFARPAPAVDENVNRAAPVTSPEADRDARAPAAVGALKNPRGGVIP